MVLDQAGWHGARALAVPANVTLVPLPPYSPELNPVEWVCLTRNELSGLLAGLPLCRGRPIRVTSEGPP